MSKNSRLLASFSEYCHEHPEERFWQALRNWYGVESIVFTDKPLLEHTTDTYYLEGPRIRECNRHEFVERHHYNDKYLKAWFERECVKCGLSGRYERSE